MRVVHFLILATWGELGLALAEQGDKSIIIGIKMAPFSTRGCTNGAEFFVSKIYCGVLLMVKSYPFLDKMAFFYKVCTSERVFA